MYKRPCNKEYEYSESKDIELIKLIIEEQSYDENFTNSMGIYFTGSFESSNELECDTTNICSIVDSVQIVKENSGQLNFENMIHLEQTKEEGAPKLELKPYQKN